MSSGVIDELRATIDAHMRNGGDAVATHALDRLGAIDGDYALLHLHAISLKATGRLKKKAAIVLGDVCRKRGLGQDGLEDAIIAGLGIGEDGTIEIDLGDRKVTAGFDELLRPFVRDEKKKIASERWKAIQNEVKLLGNARMDRLERAMCDGRFWWTTENFSKVFKTRRLLQNIPRRLVFASGEKTFRVAEDGTLADQNDAAVTLEAGARVVVAHPARIAKEIRDKWSAVLDDYDIVQPFPQIRREAPELDAKDLGAASTKQFVGNVARGGRFFPLYRKGWSAHWDGLRKDMDTFGATLAIKPGISSFGSKPEDQKLGELTLTGGTFSELGAVLRWELLRDVAQLLGPSETP
ncbi:MAG TPA: DUF4132 domain-containing protein [Polyangiaceae bacterium]